MPEPTESELFAVSSVLNIDQAANKLEFDLIGSGLVLGMAEYPTEGVPEKVLVTYKRNSAIVYQREFDLLTEGGKTIEGYYALIKAELVQQMGKVS